MKKLLILSTVLIVFAITQAISQRRSNKSDASQAPTSGAMPDSLFTGLKLRNIGPAFMSGRIADLAIHPIDDNIWYVAVASGGVWRTANAGTTWTPVFDKQKSYSIGCVSIDPSNPHTVWVGTGENIGGRHVGFGDGIYRSDDDGTTWRDMGLKNSEHISKIIIHPTNSDIIWVASQGPLWNKGGERGLFKSIDGGKTWKRTLGDNKWIGVTEVVIDPEDPNRLYAATWQRHRTVAAYIGGGPGSGLHRSTDGGETWTKLTIGLPTENIGKIGLAISQQNPDIIYAALELKRKTGGLWRSADRGTSWEKRSDAVSGGTGAHYYQELYASPHQFERLYLMDATMQMSEDGGKTFSRFNTKNRHGDNHTIAFRKDDPDYILLGTDGGVYESFDLGETWRFIENLPVTQFYKLALDDTEPFYNIFGGTQDNSTQGGPSRTDNISGIRNSDWKVVLNWDGHQPATEPGNPNIMYAERQEGTLSRLDMITGEVVDIQPQPEVNENYERFNWDAPILVSPHEPRTIFFASQRVWKSEDRGDTWKAISSDLTRNQNRIALSIMGKTQSWDESWDVGAMSNYNTITSLSESPKQQGLIYAGTDDGLLQVTEDGGGTWRKIEAGSITGVPATAFINDIKADLYDANTVYVSLDNHKYGDYSPYVVKSTNRGRTWQSIRGNIPDRTLVWRLVQDHVKPELLFLATEWGIYFSVNSGGAWTKLSGGVPNISFRDLAIQKRENDLVGASFGRGFFVFDDYSALREISPAQLQQEATLFSLRKAQWYVPRSSIDFDDPKGSQGDSYFTAPNPAFGAVFTYYLRNGLKSKAEARNESEKNLRKQNRNIPWPGWDKLEEETNQDKPRIWLTVKDANGNVVRRIEGARDKGFHRINWDLKYPAPNAITLKGMSSKFGRRSEGMMAAPGSYTVSLSKQIDGVVTQLGEPKTFEVVRMRKGALPGSNIQEVVGFWRKYEKVTRNTSALYVTIDNTLKKVKAMQKALAQSTSAPGTLDAQLNEIRDALMEIDGQLNGHHAKNQIGEKSRMTIGSRLFAVNRGVSRSTYGPTPTHKRSLEIVESELKELQSKLESNQSKLSSIGKAMMAVGAPWVEGEELPKN